MKCYCSSVGNNSTLLVNVPPDKNGRLPKKFIGRMVKARRKIEELFADKITEKNYEHNNVFIIELDREQMVSRAVIAENIAEGQRIAEFSILADGREIYRGKTVGYKKFCLFKPVSCRRLELSVIDSRGTPIIKSISLFR